MHIVNIILYCIKIILFLDISFFFEKVDLVFFFNFSVNITSTFEPKEMLLDSFAKLQKATFRFVVSVRLSVCPHGITEISLDGFS